MGKVGIIGQDGKLQVVKEPVGKPARRGPRNNFLESGGVNRFLADWVTRGASMDSLLEGSLIKERARSRWLVANDSYAAGFRRELAANVIGSSGLRLKMCAKMKSGKKPDKVANRNIEKAWEDFGKKGNFEVTGQLTRRAYDILNISAIGIDGGTMTRMVRGWRENQFRFAAQLIEIDHLDPTFTEAERKISMSVQKNGWGAPTGYWLLKDHPGDTGGMFGHIAGHRNLFAKNDILHPFVFERIGQSQGRPWIACAIPRLRQFHMYEEAEVLGARFQASKQVFFERTAEAGQYVGDGGDGIFDKDGNPVGGDTMPTMSGEALTADKLPDGYSADLIDPTQPNANYLQFRKGMLMGIAAGIILNYHTFANDLEGVAYSSARVGSLSERELWKVVQAFYIETHAEPLFSEWLEMALLARSIPGLDLNDFERVNCPMFAGRRWDWVDPDKDSKAVERRLALRLTSRQREARKEGGDFEEILMENDEDNALAEEYGIELETEPAEDLPPENPA